MKVYLFLLRHLDDPCSSLTLSAIADCLNNTEGDILPRLPLLGEGRAPAPGARRGGEDHLHRAGEDRLLRKGGQDRGLRRGGLFRTALGLRPRLTDEAAPCGQAAPGGTLTAAGSILAESSRAAGAAIPAARTVPEAVPIDTYRAQKEIRSLLFIAEQYLGKTLSHTDMETITYFTIPLHMSADLIEYLIESCVENGHKSMHYIRKVAFSWSEAGIRTVSQAKEESALYSRNCYTVLNAFGIKNRGPASSELAYIRKWAEEFGFAPDIIEEACRRTIAATHQPSFEYADTILTKWHQKSIRSLSDIAALDEAYQKERSLAGRPRSPAPRQGT